LLWSSPGHGQVLAAVKAAGVNLFDTQLRSGLYKRDLPLTLGLEGAGIVEAVGADVDHIAVGACVLYFGLTIKINGANYHHVHQHRKNKQHKKKDME
jgi:NADPH:quinone reductase-like Zn-dependent oxidoreductase